MLVELSYPAESSNYHSCCQQITIMSNSTAVLAAFGLFAYTESEARQIHVSGERTAKSSVPDQLLKLTRESNTNGLE